MRHTTPSSAATSEGPEFRISDREIATYIREAEALRRQAIADWTRRGGAALLRSLTTALRRITSADRMENSPISSPSLKARP
jgi:hypothetical protein